MSADYYVKRGDSSGYIEATLSDVNGAAVDLTGATVKFNLRNFDTGALKVSGATAAIIVPATNGVVRYVWSASNIDTAGHYFAEWPVTFPGGAVQTFPSRGYHFVVITHDLDSPQLTADQFSDVRRLRALVAEPTDDEYTDSLLAAYLDRNDDDLEATAAEVWREKAARYADLVDVSEAGASRKLSQLYDRAAKQASHFEGLLDEGASGSYPTTRPIERV